MAYGWEVMDHLPYSTDLAPSDIHLFEPLENHLAGKHFATDDNLQAAVSSG
jgi:histone-lysine N-methyltransferase SETMAR